MKKAVLTKLILLTILLFCFFAFLSHGFIIQKAEDIILPVILTVICELIFFSKKFKRVFLAVFLLLMSLMVFFYLLDDLLLATLLGNFAFSILPILLISYLPDLIKEGYVSKL